MIVKDRSRGTIRHRLKRLTFGILILSAIGALLFVSSFVFIPKKSQTFETIYCGAEDKKLDGSKWVFASNGYAFRNGHTQSDTKARTGKYSSRIKGEDPFGLYLELKDYKPWQRYYASVWRKRDSDYPGALVVNIQGEENVYQEITESSRTDKEDWELLEAVFTIPPNAKFVAVYVFGSGVGSVYFDDFKLSRVNNEFAKELTAEIDTTLPELHLHIDQNGMRKLNRLREDAMESHILITQDDSWIKGKIVEGEETTPVQLRFKGDWVDHLRSDKWSFRIKVKEPFAWNRLITFSIHNPKARYYLHEWLYHQLLIQEDLLTSRYDFVHVKLNNQPKGIYAFEEHFEKHLPEFRSRREGPILKLSEEGVWNARKRRFDTDHVTEVEDEMNTYEAADIQPFTEKKTLESPQLAKQFEQAKTLLDQYKYGTRAVSEVFDLDRLAKFYALVDLTQAYHNLIWHNMRFYFNPVTARLEPIGFDGFTELGAIRFIHRPLIGTLVVDKDNIFKNKLHSRAFEDPKLVEKYNYYLDQFSREEYINAFFLSVKEPLEKRFTLIQPEAADYKFSPDHWKERAAQIQTLLRPLDDAALKVYTQEMNGDELRLKLLSHHLLPVEVIGFGNSKEIKDSLESPLFLPAFEKSQLPVFEDIKIRSRNKFVFYRVPGLPDVFTTRISPWKIPAPETPEQKIFKGIKVASTDLYEVEGNRVIFSGIHEKVEEDLIFPEGYEIIFSPGTQLNLIKGTAFISRSAVQILGTAEEPIVIRSSDGTGQGFTVIQAEKPSKVDYVRFDGMNTLSRDGWNLTGAVSFYESEVEIAHSVFTNNHCEDGLNLIRSKFFLSNSTVSNTYADGLDVDFCTGTIKACTFLKTGNDGADFSGSQVFMFNCNFESVGDKGISVGEQATVRVEDAIVKGAVTGVASKDLSLLRINTISFIDCQTAFAAYQKKPEFGGGKIIVENYTTEAITFFKQIEPGSEFIIKEKEEENKDL